MPSTHISPLKISSRAQKQRLGAAVEQAKVVEWRHIPHVTDALPHRHLVQLTQTARVDFLSAEPETHVTRGPAVVRARLKLKHRLGRRRHLVRDDGEKKAVELQLAWAAPGQEGSLVAIGILRRDRHPGSRGTR